MRLLALMLCCACAVQRPVQHSATSLAFEPLPPERKQRLLEAMPAVEKRLAELVEKEKYAGMAFGVVLDGELVWTHAWGVRDVAAKAPADADTLFRIASMSKAFTGVAILQLRDAGKLRLDEPAETYLPELSALRYPTRDSPRITVRDLLNHAAGFPEDNPFGDLTLPWSDARLLEVVTSGGQFSTAPETHYEYSNLGFQLLGQIVQRVSGVEYSQYMRTHVLGPLGMTSSTYDPRAADPQHVAQGYAKDSTTPVEPLGYGAGAAMGGLYTSVRELAKWAAFQLDAWPPRDDPDSPVLSRTSRREAQTMTRFPGLNVARDPTLGRLAGAAGGYAYGWGSGMTCSFESYFMHSGGLPGFGSNIRVLPERGVAFVAMANQTYASASRLTLLAAELLEPVLPARKPVAAKALTDALAGLQQLYAQPSLEAQAALWDAQVLAYLGPQKLLDAVTRLRAQHGACRAKSFTASNALRGKLEWSCDKGAVEAFVTMSPQTPSHIQELDWSSAEEPAPRLREVAETAASLLAGWDDGAFHRIAAVPLEPARSRFTLVGADLGACKLDPLVRDGKFSLACEHGKGELTVALNDAGRATKLDVKLASRCSY